MRQTFRNGRTVYNSILEKTVRGNSIDAKQFDDNAPHLSLARCTLEDAISSGAPFFRYMEKIEIRSLSLRASLVIQFRETPTAFVRNSARRNRAAFSSMYFIMRNRRAVDEGEKGGGGKG